METYGENTINQEAPGIIDRSKLEEYERFLEQHLKNLEQLADKSGGFMYIPANNITARHYAVRLGETGEKKGVYGPIDKHYMNAKRRWEVEISEPLEKKGINDPAKAKEYMRNFPTGLIKSETEFAYKDITRRYFLKKEPKKAEIGGPIELIKIKLYTSHEGVSLSLKLTEDGTLTVPGAEFIRGKRFPKAQDLVKAVKRRESDNLGYLQRNSKDKVYSPAKPMAIGFWTVRFRNKYDRIDEIYGCDLRRNKKTGALEMLTADKILVFDDIKKLNTKVNFEPEESKIHILVSYDEIKKIEPENPIMLQKLYFDNKQIGSIEELPENYRHLFEIVEGRIYLKNPKIESELDLFLKQDENTVKFWTTPDMKEEISRYKGELFEKMVEKLFNFKRNSRSFHVRIPPRAELEKIIGGQPPLFIKWAMNLKEKVITVKPDFVLPDGTFVETKLEKGGAISGYDQRHRMVLYQLLNNKPIKIKYLFLVSVPLTLSVSDESEFDYHFPSIKYESVNKERIEDMELWKIYGEWNRILWYYKDY